MRSKPDNLRSSLGTRCGLKGKALSREMKSLVLASVFAFVCAEHVGSKAMLESTTPATPPCSRPGYVWWNELLATDTDKLAAFYADVIGWTIRAVDPENTRLPPRTLEDRYILFMDGSQEAAGLIKSGHRDAAHPGAGWFMYIHVLDVDAAVTKVQEKGGKVLRSVATTAEGDRIVIVSDPLGNLFGLVTPAKPGC